MHARSNTFLCLKAAANMLTLGLILKNRISTSTKTVVYTLCLSIFYRILIYVSSFFVPGLPGVGVNTFIPGKHFQLDINAADAIQADDENVTLYFQDNLCLKVTF
jgi:hypothetical protein